MRRSSRQFARHLFFKTRNFTLINTEFFLKRIQCFAKRFDVSVYYWKNKAPNERLVEEKNKQINGKRRDGRRLILIRVECRKPWELFVNLSISCNVNLLISLLASNSFALIVAMTALLSCQTSNGHDDGFHFLFVSICLVGLGFIFLRATRRTTTRSLPNFATFSDRNFLIEYWNLSYIQILAPFCSLLFFVWNNSKLLNRKERKLWTDI